MGQKTVPAALAAIVFASILAGAYFFAASGITMSMMLTVNAMPLIKAMLSVNFALFVIMGGIAVAGILALAKTQRFLDALIFSEASYLAGACISAVAFSQLGFLLALIFGAIGIYFATAMLPAKEAELKKWALLRSGAASASKITLSIAIGLFLSMIIITAQNPEAYEKDFVPSILSITIGESATFKESLNAPLADAIVQTQQQTLETITTSPQYRALEQKNDEDVLGFVASMDSFGTQMKTKQYRDALFGEMSSKNGSLDIGESILDKMPMMRIGAQYAWLLYALEGLILVLFIGGLFTKNIAGAGCWALSKAFAAKNDPSADPKEAQEKRGA